MLLDRGERMLDLARDVCFADVDWMPAEPPAQQLVDSLQERQLHVAGLALALAIGAYYGQSDADSVAGTHGRGDRRKWMRRMSGGGRQHFDD